MNGEPAGTAEATAPVGLWLPIALTFFASMFIMTLELVAARLISRYLGSSLYTWTSVIAVILAGIAIGNRLGGSLADRYRPRAVLPVLFAVAAGLSVAALGIDAVMASVSRPEVLPWPAWILTGVAVTFLLPATALGTISPVVARWALRDRPGVGATVGALYAAGTAGAIAGTFLTGFVLIGLMGTRAIVGTVAVGLGAMGGLITLRRDG